MSISLSISISKDFSLKVLLGVNLFLRASKVVVIINLSLSISFIKTSNLLSSLFFSKFLIL